MVGLPEATKYKPAASMAQARHLKTQRGQPHLQHARAKISGLDAGENIKKKVRTEREVLAPSTSL